MAVQPWKWYNNALLVMGQATAGLRLDNTTFHITLHTSASNFATRTLKTLQSVTTEVTSGFGYCSSGKALTTEVWVSGASGKQRKWDCDDVFWSANAGTIANIKGAVIWNSGASANARFLLCFCSLTSTQFSLAAGNRLTIQMASGGVLTITAA